ncbi:hypothetical protein H4W80_001031 [Nonomuraea angiospora]|uniref:Uncharacterized protein n=1 Tax=Nonomuraea angiospora TaxID=46172 RepID=A0ABR9LQ37_9ACTN|nr:hypothetical protein [Nonomuraea angiospora]
MPGRGRCVGRQPFVVDGDPVLLSRLVTNLLDNAVRYNRPGGQEEQRSDTCDTEGPGLLVRVGGAGENGCATGAYHVRNPEKPSRMERGNRRERLRPGRPQACLSP